MNNTVIGSKEVETGEIVFHAKAAIPGDYPTLCGVSLNDSMFEEVEAKDTQKITCTHCWALFNAAKNFKVSDFSKKAKA